MVSIGIKLDKFVNINKLPKIWRAELRNGKIMQQTFKSVGLQYLRQQQKRYLKLSEGGGEWKDIGLLGRLIRKKGRRAKSVTIKEFFRRTENMKILRDTSALFNSLSPGRASGKRILKVKPLRVTVGTRDKKALKHHFGRVGTWPSKRELQKALDRNFKRRIPKSSRVLPKGTTKRGGARQKDKVKKIETGALPAVRKVQKAVKSIGKGIRKAKKALKQTTKAQQKPNNSDYIRMQFIINKRAGQRFTIPQRKLIKLPTPAEFRELENLVQKGVRKAEQKVNRFLNR